MTIERLYEWYMELCNYTKERPPKVEVHMAKQDLAELFQSMADSMAEGVTATSHHHTYVKNPNYSYELTFNGILFQIIESTGFSIQMGAVKLCNNIIFTEESPKPKVK